MTRLLPLTLLACLSLPTLAASDNASAPAPQPQVVPAKPVVLPPIAHSWAVDTRSYERKHPRMQVSVKVPVVKGLTPAAELAVYLNLSQPLIKRAQQLKAAKVQRWPQQFAISFDSYPNRLGLISLTVDDYAYTGGAHGGTDRSAYLFDPVSGRRLNMLDLFADRHAALAAINAELARQIDAANTQYRQDNGSSDPSQRAYEDASVTDLKQACLKNDELDVFFGLYEIAPYSAGIPTFAIPLATLKPLLKPAYQNKLPY
ncbi:DUF3298 and DUF4163 domain-containing protein [Neisseriaceae bacterium JH1-16]|nr:DUF3298 and DUF4163 domain-containing protein [Neisseriaceae bacterium JH1-16]